jgi:hypothetical protein
MEAPMSRLVFLSSFFALFLFTPYLLFAADDLDRVNFVGDVRDGAGNVIVGARVKAILLETRIERETFSDLEGRYRLMNLTPGRYELRIDAYGFQSVRFENITAAAGLTIKRDFYLDPAAVQGEMTVNAAKEQSLVDTTRTVVGGTLGRIEIDKLPTESRNPLDLIFTLPGVARPPFSERNLAEGDARDNFQRTPEEAGVFGLSGGSPFSNNITIEGLDNNDDRAARERFVPSIDSVEEVQVITNQFSAEYGRASGGRVNLRLRGGANQYRGRGYYYFRDESLNANSFFRNADPLRGFRIPFQNQNPGLTFGGPIKKDKIYFFAGYEYDRISDQADISALTPVGANPLFPLPSPNGVNLGFQAIGRAGAPVIVNDGADVGLYDLRVSTPRRAHTVQSRTDFKFSPMHDGFALYTYARNRDERGFPGGRRTLDTLRFAGRDSQSIAFSDNYVFSPSLFNNARFQYSRLSPVDAPGGTARPVVIINFDDPRDVAGNDAANPLTRSGNLTAGASTLGGVDRQENRYQMQDTVSYVRRSLTFRAGVDLQRVQSRFVDLEDASGTFQFASPADFLANRFSRYQHRFFTESKIGNTYTGLFVQNDWKPWPELTLSFGLRWDYETALNDRNNFGPRLALAWAPRNSSKTVFRAGYGIFYNRALLRTLDDFTLTSNTILVDTNNPAAAPLLSQLSFPTALSANDPRVRAMGIRESGFLRRLGADFRIPESYQASAGFERQLTRNLKIETNYVFHRGSRLWREVNANAPRLPAGFNNFSDYLVSRDFDNRRDSITNQRPISATGNADVVRFDLGQTPSRTLREGGQTVVVFGLNNPSTSNQVSGLAAARAALRPLREDPSLSQVEELQSVGNSFYHGLSFELTTRIRSRGNLRASYTLSKLTDDGVVNTSSPLVPGDFRRERSRSLLDARHRVSLSGFYETPPMLGRINLVSILNFNSAQPFNIGANGNDRNLDDINNDRPNFTGNLDSIRSRRPGQPLPAGLSDQFSLPTIGSSGNLPRNAGLGSRNWTLNSRVSRQFAFDEQRKVELQLEAFNPLNATVYDFGAEFVDFNPASLGGFLTPRRTIRPRTMRLGLRFEF